MLLMGHTAVFKKFSCTEGATLSILSTIPALSRHFNVPLDVVHMTLGGFIKTIAQKSAMGRTEECAEGHLYKILNNPRPFYRSAVFADVLNRTHGFLEKVKRAEVDYIKIVNDTRAFSIPSMDLIVFTLDVVHTTLGGFIKIQACKGRLYKILNNPRPFYRSAVFADVLNRTHGFLEKVKRAEVDYIKIVNDTRPFIDI
jgi:hypothetical protein